MKTITTTKIMTVDEFAAQTVQRLHRGMERELVAYLESCVDDSDEWRAIRTILDAIGSHPGVSAIDGLLRKLVLDVFSDEYIPA